MHSIFVELSIVLVVATVIAGLMQFLRQPLIIGHIITGLLVGPYVLNVIDANQTIEIFSQLGIALLIFIIGLSLSPRVVKDVGKVALLTGLGQVSLTTGFGYLLARTMDYEPTTALYIGLAISFSSTIIILKLLSDKKDLGRLYGRIAIGFLLVQDIIAMLVLIGMTSFNQDKSLTDMTIDLLFRGSLLLGLLSFVSAYVLPWLVSFFAKSQEFLFIFSISWGLAIASLFQIAGFSIEIGALFAGIVLANSPYSYEISSRLRPLRDFFIVLFFILLGSQMKLDHMAELLGPVIILSLFILVGKPLIVMILAALQGYNKKTSFKAGLSTAQISEFSLILIVLANQIGYLSEEVSVLITSVGLITIAVSTYYILYSDDLYSILAPSLSFLERRKVNQESATNEPHDIILFGYDTVGQDFIKSFKKLRSRFLVVDYDPEVIAALNEESINCRYGDADDNELLDELGLEKVKMVISTIADFETSLLIVKQIRRTNKKAIVIVKSDQIDEAAELYDQGASYVMMPHYLGSTHTCSLISKHGFDLSEFTKEREKHLHYLEKRLKT